MTVESNVELLVQVMEPRLTLRSVVGARVAIASDHLKEMTPYEARHLGDALCSAAGLAEQADERLLPILDSFVSERDRLLVGGDAS